MAHILDFTHHELHCWLVADPKFLVVITGQMSDHDLAQLPLHILEVVIEARKQVG